MRRRKVSFRLVSERGLNPLVYPLALVIGVMAAMALAGVRARDVDAVALSAPSVEWPLSAAPAPAQVPEQPPAPVVPAAVPATSPGPEEIRLTQEASALQAEGTLRIEGPRGARIFIDHKPRGVAPASFSLPTGTHLLRIQSSARAAKDELVRIESGATVRRGNARGGKYVPPQPNVSHWP